MRFTLKRELGEHSKFSRAKPIIEDALAPLKEVGFRLFLVFGLVCGPEIVALASMIKRRSQDHQAHPQRPVGMQEQ
jgi:hypothetical protein